MDTAVLPVHAESREAMAGGGILRELQGLPVDEDVSLLRQPMLTALNGFLEAKKAYENGTEEVRRLLIHECSLIYECNKCRNMFRSLVNFISHKRIYCKLSSEGNHRSYADNNTSLIIQTPDPSPQPWSNKSRSTGSSPIPRKSSTRDLSKIIERLKRVEDPSATPKVPNITTANQQNGSIEASMPSPSAGDMPMSLPIEQLPAPTEPVLQLESVPTSTQAVYQTFNPLHSTDSIRTEVNEVHDLMITQQNATLGPDGKAIISAQGFPTHRPSILASEAPTLAALLREIKKPLDAHEDKQAVQSISCEICQMTFLTEKTLNIHIQKKHSSSTYVFPCPACSATFLQPAAVIRHLANEHKKPMKRIRKMRDGIIKKRIQIGDVQVKGPSRELKRLQMDTGTKDMANITSQDSGQSAQANGKRMSTCSFCQTQFEKRAAYVMHLSSCSSKKKSSAKDQADTGGGANEEVQIRMATRKMEMQTKLQNQNINLSKTIAENQITSNVNPNETRSSSGGANKKASSWLQQSNAVSTSLDYDYLSHSLNQVHIKQEPQEEELNSTSTHATNGSTHDINEMFENLEKQTFGEGLQVVSLDLMISSEQLAEAKDENSVISNGVDEQAMENTQSKVKEERLSRDSDPLEQPLKPLTDNVGQKKKQKGFRIASASKQLACRCKICNKQFNALSNLRRHISLFHYRARRFGCTFCDYRAFRRYDIVNHLTFIHGMRGERESMAIEFVTMHDIPYSKDDVEHDIVVVQETVENTNIIENTVKKYENKLKRPRAADVDPEELDDSAALPKALRKRLRKSLSQQDDKGSGQKRPIRNRIKPVNNDFVYDLSALKEEPKDAVPRITLKRRSTFGHDIITSELTPAIKITPYRLRTEPLIPANKSSVRGMAERSYRKVVQEGLASPSTVPELPAERPQMRPRPSPGSRADSVLKPVIEATELEVARLQTTFFDDSFLEKFAKKSNPSFKMKPLLGLSESPLHSLLQKFENNSMKMASSAEELSSKSSENDFEVTPEKLCSLESSPPSQSQQTMLDLQMQSLDAEEMQACEETTPNGKYMAEPTSPPSTPKKRITLMQRLAENRAKRRDTLKRSTLDN